MESFEKVPPIHIINTAANTSLWAGDLYKNHLKRLFDIILAILFFPLIAPVLLLCMLLVKLDSKGPAIYKSSRIGKDGKKFSIFKLRTMCLNAEQKLQEILSQNSQLRMEWEMDHKLKDDPRITRFGKIMRALSLDELPQIFNVFKGEMSFVGPRPIVEAEILKYGKQFECYKSVMPGVTGLWQVSGRNDISYAQRVNMDAFYTNNSSFILDIKLLFQTIPAAISKKGAY